MRSIKFVLGMFIMLSVVFICTNVYAVEKGDINQDGVINSYDLKLLKDYLAGNIKLTDDQKEIANVNQDKYVNEKDALQLARIIEMLVYKKADINQDGKVNAKDFDLLLNYLSDNIEVTSDQLTNFDVNIDGVINAKDAIRLLQIIEKIEFEIGDINRDGEINDKDVKLLKDFLAGKKSLTSAQLKIADIDQDNKVTNKDALKLRRMIKAQG